MKVSQLKRWLAVAPLAVAAAALAASSASAVTLKEVKDRGYIRIAVANEWAKTASYGPRWMWHVSRVHYERLAAEDDPATTENVSSN